MIYGSRQWLGILQCLWCFYLYAVMETRIIMFQKFKLICIQTRLFISLTKNL